MKETLTSAERMSPGQIVLVLAHFVWLACGSAGCFWLCFRVQTNLSIGNLWVAIPMDVIVGSVFFGFAAVVARRLRRKRGVVSWLPAGAVALISASFMGFIAWREQGWVYYRNPEALEFEWRVNRRTLEFDVGSGPIVPLDEPFAAYAAHEKRCRVTRQEWERE